LHLSHRFVRGADQSFHFPTHLFDQSGHLQSSVPKESESGERHQKDEENEHVDHRLSIDEAEEDQDRNQD
jgi:hypothetical protein